MKEKKKRGSSKQRKQKKSKESLAQLIKNILDKDEFNVKRMNLMPNIILKKRETFQKRLEILFESYEP
jgi:hypothetical protein